MDQTMRVPYRRQFYHKNTLNKQFPAAFPAAPLSAPWRWFNSLYKLRMKLHPVKSISHLHEHGARKKWSMGQTLSFWGPQYSAGYSQYVSAGQFSVEILWTKLFKYCPILKNGQDQILPENLNQGFHLSLVSLLKRQTDTAQWDGLTERVRLVLYFRKSVKNCSSPFLEAEARPSSILWDKDASPPQRGPGYSGRPLCFGLQHK